MTMKWRTFVIPTMSCKILGTGNLEREVVSWLSQTAKLLFIFLFFFFSLRNQWTHKREWLKRDAQDFINRSKYRIYISSVQQSNRNSIEFSLSTQTRSRTKSSQLHSYIVVGVVDVPHFIVIFFCPLSDSQIFLLNFLLLFYCFHCSLSSCSSSFSLSPIPF